jgi:hypothetical protein
MEGSLGANAYASRFSQGATIVPRNFFFVDIAGHPCRHGERPGRDRRRNFPRPAPAAGDAKTISPIWRDIDFLLVPTTGTAYCGVDGSHFQDKRIFIDRMILKRRNAIAHGQTEFIEESDIDDLIADALGLMDHFRSLLENKVYTKSYLAA